MNPILYKIYMSPQLARIIQLKHSNIKLYETSHIGDFLLSNASFQNLKLTNYSYELLKSYLKSEVPVKIDYPLSAMLFAPPDIEAQEEAITYAFSKLGDKKEGQVIYLGRKKQSEYQDALVMDRPGGTRSYYWQFPQKVGKVQDIRDSFPKITERIHDKNTKFILSL